MERETAPTNEAVDETRGLVMTYQGKPIDALYSSACGGHTQDNIFGDSEDIPYLKGRPDSLDAKGPDFPLSPYELEQWLNSAPGGFLCDISEGTVSGRFRWTRIYSKDEMNKLAKKLSYIGDVRAVEIVRREKSGHVSSVKLVGSESSYTVEKELNIRKALGNLRSSMFKVEVKLDADKNPQEFIFYGGGWGHGVGMCQSGAAGLAKKGKAFEEILRHYFRDIELRKLY